MRIEIVKPSAVLPAALAAVLPTAAFAVDYMSPQQAQLVLFPTADRFDARDVRLDASQLKAVQQRYGVQALGDHLARHFGLDVVFVDDPNPA